MIKIPFILSKKKKFFQLNLKKTRKKIFISKLKYRPYGAGERIKSQLSYRLGNSLLLNSQNIKRWYKIPFDFFKQIQLYKQQQKKNKFLPPIFSYADFQEADKFKKHLSYRLGQSLVRYGKNPLLWILLPVMLAIDILTFKKKKQLLQSKFTQILEEDDHPVAIARLPKKNLLSESLYINDFLKSNDGIIIDKEAKLLCDMNYYFHKSNMELIKLSGLGSFFDRLSCHPMPIFTGGPLVSVIMPAYNSEKTLTKSAQSILNQTWGNLELIIINDGSTDKTLTMINNIAMKDNRVRILENSKNYGPYVSKNIALKIARGDWITGQDADDWSHPQRIQKHLNFALKLSSVPKVSLSYMIRINLDGTIKKKKDLSFLRKSCISAIFQSDFLRKSLGFWDTVRCGADSELISRAKKIEDSFYSEFQFPSMICLNLPSSLTNNKINGFDPITQLMSSDRKEYINSYKKWHSTLSKKNSYLKFPHLGNRKFNAPSSMIVPDFFFNNLYLDKKQKSTGYVKNNSWEIVNEKIIYHHPKKDVFWKIPKNFQMPSRSVISLVEYLLLKPFNLSCDIIPKAKVNTTNKKVAIAFSGGIDSTAACLLLPNSIPIYTKVKELQKHKIENAMLSLKSLNGVSVESNYNEFGTLFGKKPGYYGAAGFTLTSILFSEYYNIKTVCDGNVCETCYMYSDGKHGTRYNLDYVSLKKELDVNFRKVGLEYGNPCAGLTEVGTTIIAGNYKFSLGCMRGIDGRPCYTCLKCFRKEALRGVVLKTNPEVDKKLTNQKLIPMLPSLLYSKYHHGLSHPSFNNIKKNIDFVDKWYPRSLELMPEYLHETLKKSLLKFGINELKDPSYLEEWISS